MMLKSILYWTVPISCYFVCMYLIAFNGESLSLTPFMMGIPLTPFIAIPMSIGAKYLCKFLSIIFRSVPEMEKIALQAGSTFLLN